LQLLAAEQKKAQQKNRVADQETTNSYERFWRLVRLVCCPKHFDQSAGRLQRLLAGTTNSSRRQHRQQSQMAAEALAVSSLGR
jgi:hypothetical protein